MNLRAFLAGSVRRKTMAVVLATTLAALVVNALVLLVYEISTYRDERIAELRAQVEILGRSAAPALAFNDRKEADAALASMKARSDVVRAALYRPDGTVFATYEPTAAWTGEQFSVTREIVEGGQLLGSAELVTRSQLGERVLAYSGIVLAVMALALGAALVLSAWLQRVITRPILDIDAAARNVIQGNDYAIRARKSTEDEIGALADAFNRMLDEIHRRTAELGESEVRFRTLADSAPVLMWLNDDNGAVFVNKAYLDFLGVTGVVDVQRLDWAQFVHPEDRAAYVESYLEAARSGRVFSREFRFRRHDGQYRWMRSVGVPRVTQDGAMRGYTGCTFDVHDAREAAEALRAADRRKDEFRAPVPSRRARCRCRRERVRPVVNA